MHKIKFCPQCKNSEIKPTDNYCKICGLELSLAQNGDVYIDENQTVWTPPTAFAYAVVCKARDKWQKLAKGSEVDMEYIQQLEKTAQVVVDTFRQYPHLKEVCPMNLLEAMIGLAAVLQEGYE